MSAINLTLGAFITTRLRSDVQHIVSARYAPIMLSNGRGRMIRTPDPLVPNQVLYQAELCPDAILACTTQAPCAS